MVILICGLTISSCKKDPEPTPDPEPTTQTVLAGMTAVGMAVYDSVTYSYEYDDQYRIVRKKVTHTPSGSVIRDFQFTYGDGRLTVGGIAGDDFQTYECTLDSEGRITHVDETTVLNDTTTAIRRYDYTYDAEGRLATIEDTTESNNETTTYTLIWEER